MGITFNAGGTLRHPKSISANVSGSLKTIKEIWVNNGGTLHKVWPAMNLQTITASGTWKVPNDVYSIDIFCVGGGGGGGRGRSYTNEDEHAVGGGGGAGGHTTTEIGVKVTPGESLTIVIGAGGTADRGNDGGASSV